MKKKLLFLLVPLLIGGLSGCVKYNGRIRNKSASEPISDPASEPISGEPSEDSSLIPTSGDSGSPLPTSSDTSTSSDYTSNTSSVVPSSSVLPSDELPVGAEVKIYLVFGEYGLYKGQPVNTTIDSKYLEHAMEYVTTVGSQLPTRDDVTSSVSGSKFVAWTSYNNDGKLTTYTKAPGYQEKVLYASFSGGGGVNPSGSSSQPSGSSSSQPGGSGSSSVVPSTLTYTVTNLPDWIQNNGCVIFAWVWGAQDQGSWKSLTYGNNNDATFIVSNSLDGFLLARCISGTTTPDWSVTGDSVGRIYNKTNDIACSAGVYSYACSEWVEYNG